MFLSEQDIIDLTNRKHHSAQRKQLDKMGITYHKRGDGSLAVSKKHIEKKFDGEYSANESTSKEPNWGALAHEKAA